MDQEVLVQYFFKQMCLDGQLLSSLQSIISNDPDLLNRGILRITCMWKNLSRMSGSEEYCGSQS